MVTGVAEQAPERVVELVYHDACVPGDDQSLLDLLPPERQTAFRALAAAEVRALADAPLRPAALGASRQPRGAGDPADRHPLPPHAPPRFRPLRAAETPGRRHRELDCGHLPYVGCPEEPAAVLLELVGGRRVPAGTGSAAG